MLIDAPGGIEHNFDMQTDEDLFAWAEGQLLNQNISMDDMVIIDDDGDEEFEEVTDDRETRGKQSTPAYFTGSRYVPFSYSCISIELP